MRVAARRAFLALVLVAAGVIALAASPAATAQDTTDWKSDWAVEESLRLTIDTEGYSLPTAIAFVPDPGDRPTDPLYFVTELRGEVKVVTNDRTVHPFASVQTLSPREEAPATPGQAGLAGICLDPEHGYVFVTFSYQASDGALRNNIARFDTTPRIFGQQPTNKLEFTDIFASSRAGVAHQIGGCQVADDSLFVGVGDGWDPANAQRLDSPLGKVLRMSLDGKPLPENPFAQDDKQGAAGYVWAYGVRNPFGLKVLGDQLYATINGPNVDSFLRIEKGRNYLWNGTDWSIGIGADAVFAPSLSPVQLDRYPSGSQLFPEAYRNLFFFAVAGNDPFTPEAPARAGVIAFPYDLDELRLLGVPRYVVRYQGADQQLVAGLAFGPDGLYFAPLLPGTTGESPIIRVTYDPANEHPYLIGRESAPLALMMDEGCFSCHNLAGSGGSAGPALDADTLRQRLVARLLSDEYRASVEALDDPKYRNERADILAAEGEDRLQLWVKTQILTPGFDNPGSQMPDLGLTESEADTIAAFLLVTRPERGGVRGLARRAYRRLFGEPTPWGGAFLGFAGGAVFMTGVFGLWLGVRRRRGRGGRAT